MPRLPEGQSSAEVNILPIYNDVAPHAKALGLSKKNVISLVTEKINDYTGKQIGERYIRRSISTLNSAGVLSISFDEFPNSPTKERSKNTPVKKRKLKRVNRVKKLAPPPVTAAQKNFVIGLLAAGKLNFKEIAVKAGITNGQVRGLNLQAKMHGFI